MDKNFIRIITQKLGIYEKVAKLYSKLYVEKKYHKIESINRAKLSKLSDYQKTRPLNNLPTLSNSLPNSGGIQIDVNEVNVETLYNSMVEKESRVSGVKDFEGMALNDALAVDNWKHYSFYDIAEALSNLAKSHTNKQSFSALEMGCGAGTMYQFIKYMGCNTYLGLDGNPLAFKYSPYILDNFDSYKLVNLQEEINYTYKFDVIFSFEVLEHIREDKTNYFLKSIVNHMDNSSVFIGTIAHSVMDVHINIQTRNWWLNEFEKVGLKECKKSTVYQQQLADNHPYNWTKADSYIFILTR